MAANSVRRCSYFFLYDGSKVRGEGDPTRDGICYFYPEETPVDKQELLCGQLAGVGRCVSELSSSPVRVLRLHRHKYAIHMRDDFFWALGCSADVPTAGVCELLRQLINVFCFFNGSVRQSYQLNSPETLATRWARYLSYLRPGSSELHQVFSCVRTIDSTNVDPLLLLKAALILQACQHCPLVSAGCILFRGRVVSTQMCPELTVKVMVHERDTYTKSQSPDVAYDSDSDSDPISFTSVFLTRSELQDLHSAPVHRDLRDCYTKKTGVSRTLSQVPSSDSESSELNFSLSHDTSESELSVFSPTTDPPNTRGHSSGSPLFNGRRSPGARENLPEESNVGNLSSREDGRGLEEKSPVVEGVGGQEAEVCGPPPPPSSSDSPESLICMSLYLHRVKGLVLALLVDPDFLNNKASMEEVFHSSLASLNGLEAHLRAVPPVAPAPPVAPYMFAHFDCVQSTMTTNMSAQPGGATEHPFVKATSLLHSHFWKTKTLQEAIIRSAGAAVYGTRSAAQETYFQQHGGLLRNSGIPNHQDSAFSLPTKARHRLLKHGVNLL
ncbi:BLOC-3 complex member HPS4 [Cynoglossus semilaevis]|uniref:BLOC-3 complex member HPS4 n=1 Tax=Cynoglossus semilaevis TaxID=244447 RepID=UPI000D6289EB|nr:Hermansky-Pudlak syndrome 4 protein [Cynoglossus semilaevis]